MIMNCIKDLILLIKNTTGQKMCFNEKWRRQETEVHRRFPHLKVSVTKKRKHDGTEEETHHFVAPEWAPEPSDWQQLDQLPHVLKLPMGCHWRKFFKHTSYLKLSDCLLFACDVGVYLISKLDIDETYFLLFRDYLNCLRFLTSKEFDVTQLDMQQERIREVLPKMTIMLPLYWNTICRHLLCHVHNDIRKYGLLWMFFIEQWHTFFKKFIVRQSHDNS